MKEKTEIKQGYIPTIEEMQNRYEDDLRKEALKSLEYENNKKIEGQGAFFKAFENLKKGMKKFFLIVTKIMFTTKNIDLM